VARTDNKILAVIGFNCTGDLGPWTLYTSSRAQIVFFPRMPALNPASPKQMTQRAKFVTAALAWQSLTAAQRAQYRAAEQRGSLKITGYNLFVYGRTTGDQITRATIARQTGTMLVP
jgi:hypothetical protein